VSEPNDLSPFLPTGDGVCEQLRSVRVREIEDSILVRAPSRAVVEFILEQAKEGPDNKPSDPSQLRHYEVVAPDIYRYSYHDSAQKLDVFTAFSHPTERVYQSHTHTVKGRVISCTMMRDTIEDRGAATEWTLQISFRLQGKRTWGFGGGLFVALNRRLLPKSMDKARDRIESKAAESRAT